ncbi:uncharacterized protein JCM6883_005582 [Sporobolomyces salmoneus]|uniref:uncharacterized protein n=1 Tax=Sporobolomyces salmoneus TaxID=183962 RepID=UPI0031706F57
MLRIPQLTRPLREARRTIWTSSTFTSTCPRSLISSIPSTSSNPAAVTLYAVSKHFPQDLLPLLQSSLSSSSPTSIGCLAEPLPSPSTSSTSTPPFTLSLATYRPSSSTESVIPFSTSLTGRPNVSLGREHKPRAGGRATEEELEFENRQFEKFLKGDKNWAFGDQLNSISKGYSTGKGKESERGVEIPELRDIDRKDVKEIVCFTADRIQPFLSALSQFPNSSTLGMTSTSTPFHSPDNLPFSLFYNDKVSSAGAVGVAIVDTASSASKSEVEIDYGNLTEFGPTTTVTSSRGNILLTLSSQNAAQLLLSSVQALPSSSSFLGSTTDSSSPFEASLSNPNEMTTKHISKDKEFYAALFSPDGDTNDLGQAKLVCRIMAGDPKRGAVSFETEEEVEIGDTAIFLHRPTSSSSDSSPTKSKSSETPPVFSFTTIEPSYVSPIHSSSALSPPSSADVEQQDGFRAFTENGIIVSRQASGGDGREVRLAGIEGTRVSLIEEK